MKFFVTVQVAQRFRFDKTTKQTVTSGPEHTQKPMTSRTIGLTIGLAGAVIGIAVGLLPILEKYSRAKARDAFVPGLDTRGPYVLAATEAASQEYRDAIAEARKLHPSATEVVFPSGDLEPVRAVFGKLQPRYAMVFILPSELDVNFAWKWLRLTTELDADPFVDVRTGFITGKEPSAALSFVRRIRTAIEKKTPLPGLAVENFGPNLMAEKR